jgi:hypothetical protein
MRYGAIREHSFVAMIGHYRSYGGDNESKGNKYPASGVDLRRVLRITRLVQVCH